MICTLLPDAVPDEDFKVIITLENHAEIVYWNDHKLGGFPGLAKLREIFLEYAKKRFLYQIEDKKDFLKKIRIYLLQYRVSYSYLLMLF